MPEGITGDALLDFVNNSLLPRLKALTGGGDRIAGLIRMAFEDANNYMKNGTLMRQVINKINGIDFNASDDRHLFGDIYEKLLKDLQSAGNAGEFYTPRAVTQFIVEQVDPHLGETLLDPACGTGGFLVCAIEHLRKQVKTEADEQFIQDCFPGIEKKQLPHMLCMTNLLLHGIDVPVQRAPRQHAGPPAARLGAEGARGRHRHQPALRRHGGRRHRSQLPRRVPHPRNRRPVPGAADEAAQAGRPRRPGAAGRHAVRRRREDADQGRAARASATCTPSSACPTACSIPTPASAPTCCSSPRAQPTTDGLVLRAPLSARRQELQQGEAHPHRGVRAERAWWGEETDGFKSRVENEQAWRVSIDQIKAGNYNLDLKNPHNSDTGPGDVDHLLPEYEKLLAQIAATRAELKAQLQEALSR